MTTSLIVNLLWANKGTAGRGSDSVWKAELQPATQQASAQMSLTLAFCNTPRDTCAAWDAVIVFYFALFRLFLFHLDLYASVCKFSSLTSLHPILLSLNPKPNFLCKRFITSCCVFLCTDLCWCVGYVARAGCAGWPSGAWPRAAEPGAVLPLAASGAGPEVVSGRCLEGEWPPWLWRTGWWTNTGRPSERCPETSCWAQPAACSPLGLTKREQKEVTHCTTSSIGSYSD